MGLDIKFADGNTLIDLDEGSYSYGGCPTCDYGSEYINEITLYTTHYIIEAVFNQMYRYAFSIADAIKILAVDLGSMTETEFVQHIDTKFHEFDALEKFEINER